MRFGCATGWAGRTRRSASSTTFRRVHAVGVGLRGGGRDRPALSECLIEIHDEVVRRARSRRTGARAPQELRAPIRRRSHASSAPEPRSATPRRRATRRGRTARFAPRSRSPPRRTRPRTRRSLRTTPSAGGDVVARMCRALGSTRVGPSGRWRATPRSPRRSPSASPSGWRASSARGGRGSESIGPGTAPTAFARNPSRSIHSGSLVTTAPPIRSEWPPMYFVTLCTTASAPSSSGRCSAGVANVLSTTTRAPASCAACATAPDVDDLEHRVRRRLEPARRGSARGGRRADRVEVGEIDVVENDKPQGSSTVSTGAGTSRRRRRPAADVVARAATRVSSVVSAAIPLPNAKAALATLQGGERRLERPRRGVAPTRVVEHLGFADRGLRVRRRLVDRDIDRAVGHVGVLAGVDRCRLEPHRISRGVAPILVSSTRRWRLALHGRVATAWTCAWRRDRARTPPRVSSWQPGVPAAAEAEQAVWPQR